MIIVSNLTKNFESSCVVDNVSFAVPHGSFFAFLEPNGAEKSKAIKMLTTVMHPYANTMYVNGFNVLKQKKRRENVYRSDVSGPFWFRSESRFQTDGN